MTILIIIIITIMVIKISSKLLEVDSVILLLLLC